MRRTRAVLTALAAGTLALTACGADGGEEPPSDSSAVQRTNAGRTIQATWPLTGLPVKGDASVAKKHPVLVLKMDNTASSAPQVGLGSADLVVEELVEGGMTRLAAFYYSEIPANAGPVRSMRSSDIGIVSPVGASVVTSGAAPITIRRINDAGITFYNEGSRGFYRAADRRAPYNLFTRMRETAALARGPERRPADYLTWGGEKDLPKGAPARSLTASFSAGHATSWTHRDGGYVQEDSFAAAGDEFPADSVLVLRVQVGDAGYKDPAGYPVPETRLEGKGQALLFHGGRVVKGTWTKPGLAAPLRLQTKQGELEVPAGHVWVELVPGDGGSVTWAK